jgi:hypothetical protein
LNRNIRRPLFAGLIAVLFALALGVGFAASSSGDDEKPVKPVGSTAVPLDVPAAGGEGSGLAEVARLPAMAQKPEPPPPPEPEPDPEEFETETETETETVPEEPPAPEPVVPPPPPEPAPPPPPPPPEPEPPPPIDFDDEG